MRIWKEFRKRRGREVWCCDGYIEGQRVYEAGFESKREAEETVAALRIRARNERLGLPTERAPVTLGELIAERVQDFNESKKNDRRKRVVLEMFRDYFGAQQIVTAITAADLLDYKRARMRGASLRPNSINRELEQVAALFNAAGTYFPALASWRPPKMPYERTQAAGRERVISADEVRRLLDELRADRRPREQHLAWLTRTTTADLFELALLTGMRRGELRLLERGWLDLNERLVQLPQRTTKTGRARTVPLNNRALEILRTRSELSTHSLYVFTNATGTNMLGEYAMYRAIRNAADAVGLDFGLKYVDGFTLHDARHTAATAMLHKGADIRTVGDVLGHSAATMTMRYIHSTLESKRRAVAALEGGEEGR